MKTYSFVRSLVPSFIPFFIHTAANECFESHMYSTYLRTYVCMHKTQYLFLLNDKKQVPLLKGGNMPLTPDYLMRVNQVFPSHTFLQGVWNVKMMKHGIGINWIDKLD